MRCLAPLTLLPRVLPSVGEPAHRSGASGHVGHAPLTVHADVAWCGATRPQDSLTWHGHRSPNLEPFLCIRWAERTTWCVAHRLYRGRVAYRSWASSEDGGEETYLAWAL